jgi:homocysteine S-methyltransferase
MSFDVVWLGHRPAGLRLHDEGFLRSEVRLFLTTQRLAMPPRLQPFQPSVAAAYRHALPQLGDDLFLTDGGLETTLRFHENIDLPHRAAFRLLDSEQGRAALRKYYLRYADLARRLGVGLLLESPTWRAHRDGGARFGFTDGDLTRLNRAAIRLLEAIRKTHESASTPIVISGCIGPRSDGFIPGRALSAASSEVYHRLQVETFAATAADMVCAMTLTSSDEAVGIVRAAQRAGLPVAVSFAVGPNGRLPTGQTLEEAIGRTDALTSNGPAYYMLNGAHPASFFRELMRNTPWRTRIRGLRASASHMTRVEGPSAATLDERLAPDEGNPARLGRAYASLKRRLPHLTIMGGCHGTDERHVEQIATACASLFERSPSVV